VGYVLLNLRNLYLLAGMLLSRPLWGPMDPLALLDVWTDRKGRFLFDSKDDEEMELEPIIDGAGR
jgi:hypothetical protein